MKPIVIVGPTSIGKTDAAIEIALSINGEIISADSMQIYKFMDIGTAKPTKSQLSMVKHHLINFKNPNETFSAGEFAKEAKIIIEKLKMKNKKAIIVGGTGFYVEALVYGLDDTPSADYKIKLFWDDICKDMGSFELFKWLSLIDGKWAEKINPSDCQRIKRGLTVFLSSKKPLSSYLTKPSTPNSNKFYIFVLYSSKEFLKKRIETRTKKMLENGLIEETKKLIDMGFGNLKALKSIGYKETLDFLNGKIKTKQELFSLICSNTLNYAKRQLTFFKSRFKDAYWIDVETNNAVETILNTISIDSHLS